MMFHDESPLEVRSLGSGSSGNALLISAGTTLVLVDCGVGSRALEAGVRGAGHALTDVSAVLLTHEHADHSRSLPRLERAGVRVVATPGTAEAAGVSGALVDRIPIGPQVEVAGITVRALPVSHDAVEPCGFLIERQGVRVAVVTDLGCEDDALLEPLAGADLIVLEANHDAAMLRGGPYPLHLKRRVLSRTGHLSNEQCANLLAVAFQGAPRARTIWLAHLSVTNNRPELARRAVARALARQDIVHPIVPLPRQSVGPTWRAGEHQPAAVQLQMPLL